MRNQEKWLKAVTSQNFEKRGAAGSQSCIMLNEIN